MIHPAGMDVKSFADATALALGNYMSVIPLDGDDWQNWGANITRDPRLTKFNAPDPYGFDDWQEWGARLSEALWGIG